MRISVHRKLGELAQVPFRRIHACMRLGSATMYPHTNNLARPRNTLVEHRQIPAPADTDVRIVCMCPPAGYVAASPAGPGHMGIASSLTHPAPTDQTLALGVERSHTSGHVNSYSYPVSRFTVLIIFVVRVRLPDTWQL